MQGECSEYGAIFEGLAMYFDRMWWGISNLEWTAYLWDTGKFVSIEILMNNEKFYAVPIRISLRYMLMSRCRAMRLFT